MHHESPAARCPSPSRPSTDPQPPHALTRSPIGDANRSSSLSTRAAIAPTRPGRIRSRKTPAAIADSATPTITRAASAESDSPCSSRSHRARVTTPGLESRTPGTARTPSDPRTPHTAAPGRSPRTPAARPALRPAPDPSSASRPGSRPRSPETRPGADRSPEPTSATQAGTEPLEPPPHQAHPMPPAPKKTRPRRAREPSTHDADPRPHRDQAPAVYRNQAPFPAGFSTTWTVKRPRPATGPTRNHERSLDPYPSCHADPPATVSPFSPRFPPTHTDPGPTPHSTKDKCRTAARSAKGPDKPLSRFVETNRVLSPITPVRLR